MSRYGQRTRLTNSATSDVVANWFGNQQATLTLEYLIVAGGGAGGGNIGGGGGAGGYRTSASYSFSPLISYAVQIGAGGTGSSDGNCGTSSGEITA